MDWKAYARRRNLWEKELLTMIRRMRTEQDRLRPERVHLEEALQFLRMAGAEYKQTAVNHKIGLAIRR